MAFAEQVLTERCGKELFKTTIDKKLKYIKNIIAQKIIMPMLNMDKAAFDEFMALPENIQNVQFQNLSATHKVSALLEDALEEITKSGEEPNLLSKGDFYKLIDYLDAIPFEINEKLNKIKDYL